MNLLDKFNVVVSDDFTKFLNDDDIVITDTNLYRIYAETFKNNRVILLEKGEMDGGKCLSTVENICRKLIEFGADRKSKILGFGGGVVTDVTGLVASLYMRGVEFRFIATTLLAQLDASLGGKNGVNLDGYKNIIGVFNNPKQVVCALDVLESLPKKELVSGYAEAIKSGIIGDKYLFELFESGNIDIREVVLRSLNIKADIVDKDPFEKLGLRQMLNLGHTFGHAIEKCFEGRYLHGEAVGIGLCFAAKGSVVKGLLDKKTADRIVDTVKRAGLPTEVDLSAKEMAQAIMVDKKKSGKTVDFVLIKAIGETVVVPLEADISVIEEFLVSLRSI